VQDFRLIKGAGVKCRHQKVGLGCKVHGKPEMPDSCKFWNCRWLGENDTADMQRPDRVHYVIDVMPDFITARDNRTGETMEMEVIQIWIDPNFPKCVEDPGLLRYLERQKKPGLIRTNSTEAYFMAPPSVTHEGWVWIKAPEVPPDQKPRTLNEIARMLGAKIEHIDQGSGEMTETWITTPDGRKIRIASVDVHDAGKVSTHD
jgi:hypothetical protein